MNNDEIINELWLYSNYHLDREMELLQYVYGLHDRLKGTRLGAEIGRKLVDLDRRGIVDPPVYDFRYLDITPDVIEEYNRHYAQSGYAPRNFIKRKLKNEEENYETNND